MMTFFKVQLIFSLLLGWSINPTLVYISLFIGVLTIYFRKISFNLVAGIFTVATLLWMLIQLIFGYDYITFANKEVTVLSYVLLILTIFIFISSMRRDEELFYFISAFCIGISAKNLFIAFYNMSIPGKTGYGSIINPLTNVAMNSPGVSIKLALSSGLYIYILFSDRSLKMKLFSIMMITSCIFSAVFLEGRTFFIIITMYFIFNIVYSYISILKKIAMGVGVLFFMIGYYIYALIDSGILARFTELGIKSNRFSHWLHAIDNFDYYYFGGLETNKSFENTQWFHNILIDTYRLSGIIGFVLILIIFIVGVMYCKSRTLLSDSLFYTSLIFSCILVMLQDVIFEGYFEVFVVFYMTVLAVMKTNNNLIRN
ncbi:hypothetical protein CGT77_13065 [Vibrio cholerae]|uniref:hypothetical protein n=1 Tax=Vibrio cholerae TaxID=666 RepID=UPI0006E52256|nr:hypothetical protein [Vibrio cholerae]EJL6615542.1 hypothetical protein [Vibrio cholerae]KQA49450.1 hypothetical protein XV77_11770 [Vibrio cholerae]PAS07946.1 hypothetical protein CGT77_13065 [Vibrio cholerae]PAS15298.1 hypothetical protein CGT75_14620 [Vibrio cholerae]